MEYVVYFRILLYCIVLASRTKKACTCSQTRRRSTTKPAVLLSAKVSTSSLRGVSLISRMSLRMFLDNMEASQATIKIRAFQIKGSLNQ